MSNIFDSIKVSKEVKDLLDRRFEFLNSENTEQTKNMRTSDSNQVPTTSANSQDAVLSCVVESASRVPWNKGKRKPVKDDCGNEWCNCEQPKLTSNAGGRGQAYCLKCGTPWYH